MEFVPHQKRDAIILSFVLIDIVVGLTAVYLLATAIELRIMALVLLAIVLLYAGWFYYLYHSSYHRVRRKLHEAQQFLGADSLHELKVHYDEIYTLYERLPEQQKRQVYGRFVKLRERIEEGLTAEKKLAQLLEHADRGTTSIQRKRYQDMYELYQKLPAPVQGKFYEEIKRVRERLRSKS